MDVQRGLHYFDESAACYVSQVNVNNTTVHTVNRPTILLLDGRNVCMHEMIN